MVVQAQQKIIKTYIIKSEKSVVKDSTGKEYRFADWSEMEKSGEYRLVIVTPGDANTEFLIRPSTEREKMSYLRLKKVEEERKPAESKYFTNGEDFKYFSSRDIYGKRFKAGDLKGKVLVLNFWFIGCPPCRREIPDLNGLVKQFANNKDVVFLAVALDGAISLENFLNKTPFHYSIIDDGRDIAHQYGIKSYPTSVVIDKMGKVRFHSSGYWASNPYWIKKTIEESTAE